MMIMFCDVCKKEIKQDEPCYGIQIERLRGPSTFPPKPQVCLPCVERIYKPAPLEFPFKVAP